MTTFVLSVIFSLAFTYILFFLLNKKQAKKFAVLKKNEEINKNFLAFRLMPTKNKLALINEIISKKYETKISKNVISYTDENKSYALILATNLDIVKQDDLINLIEQHNIKTDNLIIICQDYMPNINCNLVKNLNVTFVNKNSLYLDYFEANNVYPDCSILNEKVLKPNFKNLFKNLFQKQKAKQYFWLGFILILSSLILPFKTYYLIFGSGFMLCSILCKVVPLFKK